MSQNYIIDETVCRAYYRSFFLQLRPLKQKIANAKIFKAQSTCKLTIGVLLRYAEVRQSCYGRYILTSAQADAAITRSRVLPH